MFLEEHQNRRKMIGLAVIFFLMLMNQFFTGSTPKIFLDILIWITYSIILMIPKSWWTKIKLYLMVFFLLVETAAGVFWFHELFLVYLLSIIIFSITTQFYLSKTPIPIIMSLLLASMLYFRFGKDNLFSILPFILLTIVFYFTIRLRLQRNEMYQLNKQQLVELQDAYEQLQEASITSMKYAVLEERNRIAREIHDSVGHSLTSLIVQMQATKFMVKRNSEEAEKSLEMMLDVARQGLHDIRSSVHSLADQQATSGSTPLKSLLSRMEETSAIQYEFHSELNDEELSPEISGILFRVLQEAITNIIRHSKAAAVVVELKKDSGKIIMRIRDNGNLKSNDRIIEGFGIKGMRTRLEEIGGSLKYLVLQPNGLELTAELPIEKENLKE
jgi:signal transduction histidine kinase